MRAFDDQLTGGNSTEVTFHFFYEISFKLQNSLILFKKDMR